MGLQVPLSLPAGSVAPYAGSNAPAGWLFMYGQAVSRATYAALFLAIGTTYGAGDGSTTFNLPDARGRALFGRDDMGGAAANRLTTGGGGVNGLALGAVGGGQSVTLTAAQMPSHAHTDTGHSHTQNAHSHVQSKPTNGAGSVFAYPASGNGSGTTTDSTLRTQGETPAINAAAANIAANGSSGAHANVPPALVINYIIKA